MLASLHDAVVQGMVDTRRSRRCRSASRRRVGALGEEGAYVAGEGYRLVEGDQRVAVRDLHVASVREQRGEAAPVLGGHHAIIGRPGDESRAVEAGEPFAGGEQVTPALATACIAAEVAAHPALGTRSRP